MENFEVSSSQKPKSLGSCEEIYELLNLDSGSKQIKSISGNSFMYLDERRDGFKYGDLVSFNSAKIFFDVKEYPRLLIIKNSIEGSQNFTAPEQDSLSKIFINAKNIPLSSDLVNDDPAIEIKILLDLNTYQLHQGWSHSSQYSHLCAHFLIFQQEEIRLLEPLNF